MHIDLDADTASGPVVSQRFNALAILSVITGVVLISGVLFMPLILVLAVVPVTLGHLARYTIKRTGERGAHVAVFGLALGYLLTAFFVVVIAGAIIEILQS